MRGEVYQTKNYGEVIILDYVSFKEVKIKFINTGTVCYAQYGHIKRGKVKDKYAPVLFGVGFIGEGIYISGRHGVNNACYDAWRSMLRRCYDSDFKLNNNTYANVVVCDEWHNFQNFAEWYYSNIPDASISHDIDKDIKASGKKIYSPHTCVFVTRQENCEKAHSKNYKLKHSTGEIVNVYNLSKFCRDNDLNRSAMSNMVNGRSNYCGEWRLA